MDNGEAIKILVTALTDLTSCIKVAEVKQTAIETHDLDRILTLLNGLKSSGVTPYRCPASDCYWAAPVAADLWKHLQYAHGFSNDTWGCPFCSQDVDGPHDLINHYIQCHITMSGARIEEYV